jgi:hypothetical protein
MPIGEIAEIFVQQLLENPSLVFGSDGVADPREDDGLAVDGEAPCGHQHEEHRANADDRCEVAISVDSVDDVGDPLDVALAPCLQARGFVGCGLGR